MTVIEKGLQADNWLKPEPFYGVIHKAVLPKLARVGMGGPADHFGTYELHIPPKSSFNNHKRPFNMLIFLSKKVYVLSSASSKDQSPFTRNALTYITCDSYFMNYTHGWASTFRRNNDDLC